MRIRDKRRRRNSETPELDVTPFMNLMIVLVPVLLLSMVFTHTTVIDLDFPAVDSAVASEPAEEKLHLEVQILDQALIVSDGRSVIRQFGKSETGHDYDGLSKLLREIKARYPEKRDVLILLNANTDYQTLVTVMDRVRGVSNDEAAVFAELFPVVSLGDAPLEEV